MKRKFAFILTVLLTAMIAFNFYSFENNNSSNEVFVTRIIDGDTFEFGENVARLANINAPEKSEKGYEKAKEFLSKVQNSSIEIEEIGRDKYGRILVRVYAPEYLNLKMVKKGLATKFLVHDSELEEFNEAERYAIENNEGIWAKSELYGCFTVQIHAQNELVKIKNNCEETNLQDFIIRDESRKRYKFPNISSYQITLHTSEGKDNKTDLFWKISAGVWNNDRDTAYLLDSENKIISYSSYGY